ncbi:glycerophosphoryl diester phosphodiesterase [Streptacidiphilus sp. MAP12-33]|uniref:glycerophosphodiester phosphodiesterase n=1 Tax=Streptacidiphilus sp. MAP12-33 TaxID=3156266 RepID=UPI0035156393
MAAEDDTGLLGGPAPAPARTRRVAVVAHRGAPLLARENTLASLRAALALGADWVEVDVRLARCGTPVLLHDATLTRLWGLPRAVTDLDAAELAALPGPGGAGVPTLREGLALCAAGGVMVMVDVPGPAEGDASLALVRELGLLDSCVFAGDRTALARVRASSEAARIALSWESFLPPRRSVLARIRPQYLNVEHHRVTRVLAAFARRRGLALSVWTVDRPSRMVRVARLGADVVITNDPATLLTTLGCTPWGREAQPISGSAAGRDKPPT